MSCSELPISEGTIPSSITEPTNITEPTEFTEINETDDVELETPTTYTPINIHEIKPTNMKKVVLSDDLCKLSFKIFTNKDVEILYNPKRNMFNATALMNNSSSKRKGLTEASVENTLEPTIPLPKRKGLTEASVEVDVVPLSINALIKTTKFIRYIDRIAFLLFGQYHYQYKGKSIWNEDGTINPELLDSKSNVIKSKLEEIDDNIIETITTGPNIVRGTWFNYEFLPKILRYVNMDYEILANHYDTMLLPYLTNQNISLEEQVHQQETITLLSETSISTCRTFKSANDKGKYAENLVLQALRKVFPDAKPTNRNHKCDIEMENGEILVEVKAVQANVKEMDDKFISDLKTNESTCNIGLFINIFNPCMKTHFEYTDNQARIYINPKDLTIQFLNIIKNTNKFINKDKLITNKSNKLMKQIICMKEVETAVVDKLMEYHEQLMRKVIADMKLNNMSSSPLTLADANTSSPSIQRNINRFKVLPKFKQLVKEFITMHYKDFKYGYPTKACKRDLDEYLINNDIPNMGMTNIESALASELRILRNNTASNNHHCYFFTPGTEHLYKPKPNINSTNTTTDLDKPLPSNDVVLNEFLTQPNISQLLTREGGVQSESLAKMYSYYVQNEICDKHNVSSSRYTNTFADQIIQLTIQVRRNGKRWYIDPPPMRGATTPRPCISVTAKR